MPKRAHEFAEEDRPILLLEVHQWPHIEPHRHRGQLSKTSHSKGAAINSTRVAPVTARTGDPPSFGSHPIRKGGHRREVQFHTSTARCTKLPELQPLSFSPPAKSCYVKKSAENKRNTFGVPPDHVSPEHELRKNIVTLPELEPTRSQCPLDLLSIYNKVQQEGDNRSYDKERVDDILMRANRLATYALNVIDISDRRKQARQNTTEIEHKFRIKRAMMLEKSSGETVDIRAPEGGLPQVGIGKGGRYRTSFWEDTDYQRYLEEVDKAKKSAEKTILSDRIAQQSQEMLREEENASCSDSEI